MGGRDERWDGWLAPEDYPRVVDPPSGRIWTANARVVGGEKLAQVGVGGYDLGARQGQIRDDLLAVEKASESDMLRVQLDDRALFLARWQKLLLGDPDPGRRGEGPPPRRGPPARGGAGAAGPRSIRWATASSGPSASG